jgi:hypothetical protein
MEEAKMPAPKPYVIPPEPPRVSTLLAIRQHLYWRPLAEQEEILRRFRTQVAAQAFLDSLKADIVPKLSAAELVRRQQELDYHWQCKLDADAALAERNAQSASCHVGVGDPDWEQKFRDWSNRR